MCSLQEMLDEGDNHTVKIVIIPGAMYIHKRFENNKDHLQKGSLIPFIAASPRLDVQIQEKCIACTF